MATNLPYIRLLGMLGLEKGGLVINMFTGYRASKSTIHKAEGMLGFEKGRLLPWQQISIHQALRNTVKGERWVGKVWHFIMNQR